MKMKMREKNPHMGKRGKGGREIPFVSTAIKLFSLGLGLGLGHDVS